MVASVPYRKVPFVLRVFSAVFFPPLGRLTLDEAALFSCLFDYIRYWTFQETTVFRSVHAGFLLLLSLGC